ncbi:MAG TPA: polysaccharide biosynthesis C-terminal domain-containing protein, partial [Microterricola sp.]
LAVSPAISRLLARGDLLGARTLHTKVARAMILTSWPFYLTLATMGPAVLSIFGPEFVAGSIVLTILAGAMMIATSAGMLQSVLLQGGKSSWQMYNKAFALALSVGLNLLLVPVLGILGAALTWTACVIIDTAIASWQVHRRMGMLLEPRKLLLSMAIPLAVFGVGGVIVRLIFGATLPALIGGLLVFGAIYLVVLWFLRGRLGIVALWREIPVMRRYAEPGATRDPENPAGDSRTDESTRPLGRHK